MLESGSGPVEQHPDLWFDDGSVVLRAQNVLFKVHISQLSRHSAFFRDMFSLPIPTKESPSSSSSTEWNEEQWDSKCPSVVLHDSAEDVANLLKALYDGPTFGDNGPDDFRVVSGVLRLGNKYLIDHLREKALAHLSVAWPATLKGWDAREDLAGLYERETGTSGPQRYPSPVAVIQLARQVNAPSLLPSAFYHLSRHTFARIFEGERERGEAEGGEQHAMEPLSLADTQRLAMGKEAAHHAITSLISAMGNSQFLRHANPGSHLRKTADGRTCVSAAACRKDFSELVDLATQHYLFDRERGCADPLYVAEELGQLKSAEFSECRACAQSLESWAAKERDRLWKLVPMWFRLEC